MESTVYLVKINDSASKASKAQAVRKVLKATGFQKNLKKRDMVAIKVHVGEKNNVTHVKPELVAEAVKISKAAGAQPFITDTSTLYKGRRDNAIKHAIHAHLHGFNIENTGAPFIPVDGIAGTDEVEVRIDGELHGRVKVAGQILLSDALIAISHPTGHMGSGMGAAIKNIGMGLSSRAGKMRQHSSITPEVDPEKCEDCGKCRKWCPTDAIDEREGVSYIRQEECIGCGECIAVCRFEAVKYDWAIESAILQKSMTEHAAGVLQHLANKAVYVNVLIDVTKDCDCISEKQKKEVPDIGVLASTDIVAVDQATMDITADVYGQNIGKKFHPKLDAFVQIEHAEKIGMGKTKYKLVEIQKSPKQK